MRDERKTKKELPGKIPFERKGKSDVREKAGTDTGTAPERKRGFPVRGIRPLGKERSGRKGEEFIHEVTGGGKMLPPPKGKKGFRRRKKKRRGRERD